MINPRPSFEEIAAIYASDYSGRYIAKKASKARRARRRIAQMQKYQSEGCWLDIGCSAGFILDAAQQAGYETYGVDLDPTGLKYARDNFGIEHLYEGPLESHHLAPGSFDVITLYDVIEHVLDLHSIVAELKRILAPAGTLEIWTPDVSHWSRTRPLDEWKAVMPYKHLYYFNAKTLRRLLATHDLKIVKQPFMLKAGLRVYVQHA